MTYARQLLVVFGIGGVMLPLLLPGCTRLISRKEIPPPPVATPQAKEEVPSPDGAKVGQVGEASWYGSAHQGQETASGETFDQEKLTAAHPTLPLGTKAEVTNLETGKSVAVTINDRGPYVKGRKIDLSHAAAQKIGMAEKGVAKVKIETKSRRKPTKKKVAQRRTKSRATPVATRTDEDMKDKIDPPSPAEKTGTATDRAVEGTTKWLSSPLPYEANIKISPGSAQ